MNGLSKSFTLQEIFMRIIKPPSQTGFAIVEVLIATVVLAIGFIELTRAFSNISRVAVRAVAMSRSSNLTNAIMERVMAQDFDAKGNEAGGYALEFDGTNDYVDTGSSFQTTFDSSFTISCWINPVDGNPDSERSVFGTNNADNSDGIYSNIRTDGKIGFYYESDNGSAEAITSSAIFSDGATVWTHISLVANNSNLLIYINGNPVAVTGGSLFGITMSNWTSTTEVFIGATDNNGSSEDFFGGKIDEVRIWKKVRTDSEILADYNRSITNPYAEGYLVLYYPLNIGTGLVAFDLSSSGFHGALVNMTGSYWVTGHSANLSGEHGENNWSSYNDVDDFHTLSFIDSDYTGLDAGSNNFSGIGGRVYVKYVSLAGEGPYTFSDSGTPTDYKQITVKVGFPGTTDSTRLDAIKSAKADQGYSLTFSPYGI